MSTFYITGTVVFVGGTYPTTVTKVNSCLTADDVKFGIVAQK